MLFDHAQRQKSAASRRVYAFFEVLYTLVDFMAALLFFIGSIMFLSEAWIKIGTWLFIIGSLLFALKPTLRLIRELKLLAMGDKKTIAQKITES